MSNDCNTVPVVGITGRGQRFTLSNASENSQYETLGWDDIKAMVDEPESVDKAEARWAIFSDDNNHLARKKDHNHGNYRVLCADIDKDPPGLVEVLAIVAIFLNGSDCEIYTSRSARQDYPKCRILIPLAEPLSREDWLLCQRVLNDELEAEGVIPDRASERAVQLCYLPNKGEYYEKQSIRNGNFFKPLEEWKDRIRDDKAAIETEKKAIEGRIAESKAKREQRSPADFDSLIDAFNAAYEVEEILIQAGYAQCGNKFSHPNSESGSFSASVKDGRVHSLSTSDPLYTGGFELDYAGERGAHDAFSAFCVLFHGGDEKAALKDAGDNWLRIGGESWNKVKQREYAKKRDSGELAIVGVGDGSPLEKLLSFSANGHSQEMRQRMLDDVFVLKAIAILGQWAVLYGAPNSGKTLMVLWLLREQIQAGELDGSKVFYVNADDHYKGSVEKLEIAEATGFHMLIPGENEFKTGDVTALMVELVEKGEARGTVFILDTLKKFTDLMDKKLSSEFGDIARRYVQAGGTLIALAHVNKRKDAAGKSIHAGTSDIQDDADCTYVIETLSQSDTQTKTVCFENKKARGDVAREATFQYTIREGQGYQGLLDSVKRIGSEEREQAKRRADIDAGHEADAVVIASIRRFIKERDLLKTDLIKAVMDDTAETRHKVKKVLKRWEGTDCEQGHLWHVKRAEHNAQTYVLTLSTLEKAIAQMEESAVSHCGGIF